MIAAPPRKLASVSEKLLEADPEVKPPDQTRGLFRQTLGDVINEDEMREKIRVFIDKVWDLTGLTYGHCTQCKKRVQVEIPDLKKQADVLISLLHEAEGRPVDGEQGGTTIVVERIWPADNHAGSEGASLARADYAPSSRVAYSHESKTSSEVG